MSALSPAQLAPGTVLAVTRCPPQPPLLSYPAHTLYWLLPVLQRAAGSADTRLNLTNQHLQPGRLPVPILTNTHKHSSIQLMLTHTRKLHATLHDKAPAAVLSALPLPPAAYEKHTPAITTCCLLLHLLQWQSHSLLLWEAWCPSEPLSNRQVCSKPSQLGL